MVNSKPHIFCGRANKLPQVSPRNINFTQSTMIHSMGKRSALNPQISSSEKLPKIFVVRYDRGQWWWRRGRGAWCPCRGRATVTWGRSPQGGRAAAMSARARYRQQNVETWQSQKKCFFRHLETVHFCRTKRSFIPQIWARNCNWCFISKKSSSQI